MAQHGRKTPSSSQNRRITRKVNDSTIGSHVSRSAPRHGRHGSSGDDFGAPLDFGDGRRSRRATRGYVDQVEVSSRSAESDAAYARRRGRRSYAEEIQVRTGRRRFAFLAALAVVVLAVALVAGMIAFFAWSDSRLSLGDSNASEALVGAEDGQAVWALCTADLTTGTTAPNKADVAYMAVRIDEANRVLTFIEVPATVRAELSDGQRHPLKEAPAVGGDAELVAAVGSLLGVNFSHYAKTDAAGLEELVDLVGGVSIELPEEVDDPRAGVNVLPAGPQVLDGPGAVTLLRAANYTDPYVTQAKMRALFTVNLAERAVSGEALAFATVISDGASAVSTDWTSGQLIAMADALKPLTEATVHASVVPGHEVTGDDGATAYEIDSEALAAMMESVNAGQAPDATDADIASVNRELVTVEVRNGSDIQGAAARCGELLTSDGYVVEGVGNVDDGTIYPETFVIYKDDAFQIAARAIVSDLAAGRVVDGGDYYSFDTNVLVIIGTDWIG